MNMRHAFTAWARPVASFALVAVVVLSLRALLLDAPTQDDEALISLAILAALPWSLVMMLMDLSAGFGSRAGWVLAVGIGINIALIGWIAWRALHWVLALFARRHSG